jgi:hypothetical protein
VMPEWLTPDQGRCDNHIPTRTTRREGGTRAAVLTATTQTKSPSRRNSLTGDLVSRGAGAATRHLRNVAVPWLPPVIGKLLVRSLAAPAGISD